jgi:pimeloyl-ACP methyl ester carboxylesterase
LWDELRYLYPDPCDEQLKAPTASAFSYRRQHLRPKARHGLFHTVCQPRATQQTEGTFAFGRLLMALDSTLKSVADTPENAKVFGRCSEGKGTSTPSPIRPCLAMSNRGGGFPPCWINMLILLNRTNTKLFVTWFVLFECHCIVPRSVLRGLTEEEMAHYRRPFAEPGEGRRPTLTWPRQLPVEGEPAEVTEIVSSYAQWLAKSTVPKLFVNGEPGAALTGALRELCRSWSAQTEVTVRGLHFLQEGSPDEIGQGIVNWMKALQ